MVEVQRLDPLLTVPGRGEVVGVERAAAGSGGLCDRTGEVSPIEAPCIGRRDLAQGLCQMGRPKSLAGRRRATARQELRGEPGLGVEPSRLARPLRRDDWCHDEAVLGVSDRIGEHRVERQPSVPHRQRPPACGGARHRDRVPPGQRHRAAPRKAFRSPRPGRASARVQHARHAAVLDRQDLREHVAADAVADRLHHRQRDGGGERRIDGVAATLEGGESGPRSKRL